MPIVYYVQEPLLTASQEKAIAGIKEFAFTQLQRAVLQYEYAWKRIYSFWQNTKINNRASNKLTEEYGNTNYDAQDLTEKVEKNLSKAFSFIQTKSKPDKKQVIKSITNAGLSKRLYIDLAQELIKTGHTDARLVNCLETFYLYRDRLVSANLRLVTNFAKDFYILGVAHEDLLQEGNFGLIRAAEKFDPARNFKFSTYAAFWIRQSFINLVKTQSRLVRLPSHIHNNFTKIKKAREEFEFKYNRDATHIEIAKIAQLPVDIVEKMDEINSKYTMSFDTLVGPANKKQQPLKDVVPDPNTYEDIIEENSKKDAILSLLEKELTYMERQVIQRKFGIDRSECSFKTICQDLEIKREVAKELFDSAINKLRAKVNIEDFFNE